MKPPIKPRLSLLIALLLSLLLMAGCALTLREQPRYDPFEESTFFDDGASARLPVPDTVARGQPVAGTLLTTGRIDRQFADTFPFTVTLETLERGRERYDIFCAPCHGLVGDGNGLMVEYDMPAPDSFHDPDVRDEPAGYYFALITGGTRVMPSYAARISPEDRWAIVAYIRALQLSQNADASELPADLLPELQGTDTITN